MQVYTRVRLGNERRRHRTVVKAHRLQCEKRGRQHVFLHPNEDETGGDHLRAEVKAGQVCGDDVAGQALSDALRLPQWVEDNRLCGQEDS